MLVAFSVIFVVNTKIDFGYNFGTPTTAFKQLNKKAIDLQL